MPRLPAGKANPVAGTFLCDDCGLQASVMVITKQRRHGELYVRCGCGCDQRTGEAVHARWRRLMVARPGFEWVKNGTKGPEFEPEPGADWRPGEPVRTVQERGQEGGQEGGAATVPVPIGTEGGQGDKREQLRQALRDNMR